MGFRTPAGEVRTTQSFKTAEIPQLVRGKPDAWDPEICMDWGRKFLAFVQDLVPNSPEGRTDTDAANESGSKSSRPKAKVWRLHFVPGMGVSAELLDEEGVREVEGGEDRIGILPYWYWEKCMG